MAGSPLKRQMRAIIAQQGGVDPLFQRIADGETLKAIAESLRVSRHLLSAHLNRPEFFEKMKKARRGAATILIEDARDIADNATPEESQKARVQVEIRQWTARAWDRAVYGDKQTPQVVVDMRDLHMQAVRERQRIAEAAKAGKTITVPALPAPEDSEDSDD